MRLHHYILSIGLFILCLLVVTRIVPLPVSAESPAPKAVHHKTNTIPVVQLAGNSTLFQLPEESRFSSDPTNPFTTLNLTGANAVQPNGIVEMAVAVRNFEAITRTVTVSTVLPTQLRYIDACSNNNISGSCSSTSAFSYAPESRALLWQGEVAPAHLDYNIEFVPNELSMPYLDLADYGVANLCEQFIAADERCDAATVTFNLGVNGYASTLYGLRQHALTVSVDGVIMGAGSTDSEERPTLTHNRWLPHKEAHGLKLAGLWRDSDLTEFGRWHVAILDGLIEGHPVFYAQWHDAPHADNTNLTVRHAVALVLDGSGGMDGHAFYLYDNLSDPAATVAHGYTVGIADQMGARGQTYAFAASSADSRPPQGYPPADGIVLHLYPTLIQPENAGGKTLTFSAHVDATVPETIVTTTVAMSDADDPALAYAWSTHYLPVRWQTYLPVIR